METFRQWLEYAPAHSLLHRYNPGQQHKKYYCTPVYIESSDHWKPDEEVYQDCREVAVWYYPYTAWNNWPEIEKILRGKPCYVTHVFYQPYYHDCEFWAEGRVLLDQTDALQVLQLSSRENAIQADPYNTLWSETKEVGAYATIEALARHVAAAVNFPEDKSFQKKTSNYDFWKDKVNRATAGMPPRDSGWDGD